MLKEIFHTKEFFYFYLQSTVKTPKIFKRDTNERNTKIYRKCHMEGDHKGRLDENSVSYKGRDKNNYEHQVLHHITYITQTPPFLVSLVETFVKTLEMSSMSIESIDPTVYWTSLSMSYISPVLTRRYRTVLSQRSKMSRSKDPG